MMMRLRLRSKDAFCTALGWLGDPPSVRPLFPALAWRYFAYVLLGLAAGIAITEGVLWYLSTQRAMVSADWVAENEAIYTMATRKNQASPDDPIWRSEGIPFRARVPDRGRLLVLGDSFVWGDGYLNANDIWWRQLQRELQQRGYLNVEVVAAGLNGASTQDQLDWLKEQSFLQRLQPDAIILGYVTNDPEVRGPDGRALVGQIGREVPFPIWVWLDETLGRVAPTLTTQIRPRLTEKWANRVEDAYLYQVWERKILESPNLDAYAEVVRSLGRLVQDTGLPFFVVTLPNHPDIETFADLYHPVVPLFAEAGLPFIDLIERFAAEYSETKAGLGTAVLQWGINPANGHPGPIATRFYARAVADILEREIPQVLGERRAEPSALVPVINDWMPPVADVAQAGPGRWQLSYPASHDVMPRLPLGEPHLMLAFELPVAIDKVRLSGQALDGARLWWSSVDPEDSVDRGEHFGGESRWGTSLEWDLGGRSGAEQVNTLKLSAELGVQRTPIRSIELSPASIKGWGKGAFYAEVPDLRDEADDESDPVRSTWVLLEDSRPLMPPHTQHAEIVAQGHGRWSHWKDWVIFTASDNSSPKTNGRRYQLAQFLSESNTLLLEIDFDERPVRP